MKINYRRIKISKQRKRWGIVILILVILINIGLLAIELMKEEKAEEAEITATFSNTPNVTYEVNVIPNILYSSNVLPEEQGYFSNLINYISVNMGNHYIGTEGAEYKGDYTITGEIIAWELGTETPTPAWTKQFGIVSKKTFNTTDKDFMLSQDINIDFNHFKSFAKDVNELSGYNTTYTLKVAMLLNYTITTKDGAVEGNLNPTLGIPLGDNYFKIAKVGIEEVKNDITRTVEVPVPIDYVNVSIFATISLLCLILLILFILSSEPTVTDIQRKKIRKHFKIHGKRLVAITGAESIFDDSKSIYIVRSITDIVKISDEIERPIFYVFKEDAAEIREFFTLDRDKIYLYKTFETITAPESIESEKIKQSA